MMPALAFYKAPGTIIDKAIRVRTGSPYSHAEFLPYGLGHQRQAPAWSSSSRDGGVRCKLIRFDEGRWDIVPVPWAPDDALHRMAREDGKKYDYLGVLVGRSLGLPIQCPDRWFCFEICAYALGLPNHHIMTGSPLYNAAVNRSRVARATITNR